MRVTVVGTGYVGLVTGTCLADMGNRVVCQDVDEGKIERLERGEIPIYEPGLSELVAENQRAGRLLFTSSLARALEGAEACFVAVGTPPSEDGSADLKHVLGVAEAIARAVQTPLLLVVKSTVPVGTCEKVRSRVAQILGERKAGFACDVVSNPEFLKEGVAVDDFMRPDRIVVGADSPAAAEVMQRLYRPFVRNGHPVVMMDVRSAEMTKYAANVMLAARISLVNELAALSQKLGADIMSVRQGVGTDKRLGMSFLYPGVGYGGSCFPKDVKALIHQGETAGTPMEILAAVERVNERQKRLLAREIHGYFNGTLAGRRIALWGLAFKPKTDDVREAPALTLIEELTAAGASVSAFDPEATDNARAVLGKNGRVRFVPDLYEALDGADALALVTEWGVFRSPDFERVKALLKQPVIFDGRNQYEPAEMKAMGFEYICIGRPKA